MYKNDPKQMQEVIKVYNYLYKFSLERLQKFINNTCLMFLFANYLDQNKYTRVTNSSNMMKFRESYF